MQAQWCEEHQRWESGRDRLNELDAEAAEVAEAIEAMRGATPPIVTIVIHNGPAGTGTSPLAPDSSG